MSKSRSGTRKTSSYINNDSSKYVSRTSSGHTKRGTSGKTDAAHILSFGVANTILTNTPGRPMSEASRREFIRDLNDSSNMRIKSSYGNKVVDERRDARICHAFVNDQPLRGNSTANRAYQAYSSASNYSSLDTMTQHLGNMKVFDSSTQRNHMLKNHGNYN